MNQQAATSNVPEFSVSELAFSVKRTVEETYGRVRVRGELSRVSIPRSGHMYTGLKDDKSVIDAVCWKGVLSKLSIRPEEGLEVICTGKMTTYPGSSKYQLVIDSMELAGEGALLKMLEERKKKLAAEGLFAPERKKELPFLPVRIGVVTSPTGAVIRDILHRLNDRFPRHVLVWPVKVQGEGADQEITKAIRGFNALPEAHRPDVLIVARGGGSLEDLMAFNEENVVRAVADSHIPVISAVGHETDTTLIDYAADLRAPTPTGAAEMAVPVRLNVLAQVADNETRLKGSALRLIGQLKHQLEAQSAKLGDPSRLLEIKIQQVDRVSDRLNHALSSVLSTQKQRFSEAALRLKHPRDVLDKKRTRLEHISARAEDRFRRLVLQKESALNKQTLKPPRSILNAAQKDLALWDERLTQSALRGLDLKLQKISRSADKLELLSFENVLKRGFVVVRDEHNNAVTDPSTLKDNQSVTLQFKDEHKVNAEIHSKAKAPIKPSKPAKTEAKSTSQGQLFD